MVRTSSTNSCFCPLISDYILERKVLFWGALCCWPDLKYECIGDKNIINISLQALKPPQVPFMFSNHFLSVTHAIKLSIHHRAKLNFSRRHKQHQKKREEMKKFLLTKKKNKQTNKKKRSTSQSYAFLLDFCNCIQQNHHPYGISWLT